MGNRANDAGLGDGVLPTRPAVFIQSCAEGGARSRPILQVDPFWQETDKAAYLLRQYFFNNLHDRLSTRPFLSLVEKKWLAFQLLLAVKQCHDKGICHGDIKCENVLVTSWNWLYLADFASFKPAYNPYDDPLDFSFFFDTGGLRLCYLAPERFYEHGGEMQDAPLKPSMDVFAIGCVIAELFLEGQPLFELSQLLAYRRGQYDPSQLLEKVLICFPGLLLGAFAILFPLIFPSSYWLLLDLTAVYLPAQKITMSAYSW
ncbi:hypothetical protein CRYUN_Cryun26dG0058100 [Craigia yunnanensis]